MNLKLFIVRSLALDVDVLLLQVLWFSVITMANKSFVACLTFLVLLQLATLLPDQLARFAEPLEKTDPIPQIPVPFSKPITSRPKDLLLQSCSTLYHFAYVSLQLESSPSVERLTNMATEETQNTFPPLP
ncbi:hypothetical protein EDD18DRAFT_1156171 [Armillaria luteobubalina]|uniref:Uncharacterized protein n=1 Tax=Armillaria luteobubalina TaxID=153913 RepID=A0AA39UYB6_9AGAR|nr:hypothetical protein EDD18DRAFT_1156171 [Armillaria luteobubalina]